MGATANTIYGRSYRSAAWAVDIHTKSTGERIHVAAVCYRLKGDEPEFLLVRTRSGRWTFPKGGVDGDATHAAAAAREAYEEAGVEGRIEHEPFLWYFHSKRNRFRSQRSMVPVHAHLCEVERLVPPKEDYRKPTWFKADKARRRLRENRSAELAGEVIQVIDHAVVRIRARARRIA
ncbi:MAG TPA: NUDIX domain-containing protein [Candidatus Eisenbacteria bacterium]|nr:NUDIX domain-containing protein [Candidatus Eisenbacteria bacterium]